MPTNHLLIKGKVQGVFYRAGAKKAAGHLGISGWVRNVDGGDVEVMATGSESQLKEFTNWCRSGPDRAIVHEVIIQEMNEVSFDGFRIR